MQLWGFFGSLSLVVIVEPFADEMAGHTCYDSNEKRYSNVFHASTPFPLPDWDVTTSRLYHFIKLLSIWTTIEKSRILQSEKAYAIMRIGKKTRIVHVGRQPKGPGASPPGPFYLSLVVIVHMDNKRIMNITIRKIIRHNARF